MTVLLESGGVVVSFVVYMTAGLILCGMFTLLYCSMLRNEDYAGNFANESELSSSERQQWSKRKVLAWLVAWALFWPLLGIGALLLGMLLVSIMLAAE